MSEEMNETFGADLITLVDDEGKEQEFELIDSIELEDGTRFVALVPCYDDPSKMLEESLELVIMQVFTEGEEEYLEPVTDDDLYEKVAGIFEENLSDDYDIVGEE